MSVKLLCEGPVSKTVLNCYVQLMKCWNKKLRKKKEEAANPNSAGMYVKTQTNTDVKTLWNQVLWFIALPDKNVKLFRQNIGD